MPSMSRFLAKMATSPRRRPPPASVRIDRMGAEGDGLAKLPDGTALFVREGLPGEVISAQPIASRGGGWHARIDQLEDISPDRVTPPCRHFHACGGCSLQHWAEPAYRAWKAGLLAQALRRGGFDLPDPVPLVPGLPGERRRIDFAVRRIGGRVILGLHAPASAEVVDLTDCLILHPALMGLLPALRSLLSGLACIRREASVVLNLLTAGPDLLLRTDALPDLSDRNALIAFARTHDLPRVSVAAGRGEPETIGLLRPATTVLSGVSVTPPPGAFLQATAEGEQAIIAAVLDGLPQKRTHRSWVAELFAGCGTLTFALAADIRVRAFEGDAASVAALRQGINQGGLAGRIEPVQRDLSRQPLSAKELSGCAAVVLDPPHAGAAPQVAEIAAAGTPTVIYVSCNPATLSRDAVLLRTAGFRLAATTAIDQFLWSSRLESVSVFRRG